MVFGICCGRSVENEVLKETELEHQDHLAPDETASPLLTEKLVYDFIWEYVEEYTEVTKTPEAGSLRWEQFWDKYFTKDYILIRPSGNPLDFNGTKNVFEGGVLTDYEETMIGVESIKVLAGGEGAVAVFRSNQNFKYIGKEVQDICMWTVVLVMSDGVPKFCNMQRSTGKDINSVYH